MPSKKAQAGKKIVLHVGCGPPNPAKLHERFRDVGWVELRLDIDPNVKPDIVASITDMRAVESDSVDAVWSSHNLEHLFAHEVSLALAEFRRVIKPGGFAFITLPDIREIAKLIVADKLEEPAYVSPAGPVSPIDMIFGYRPAIAAGNVFMAHRTAFTTKTLGLALGRAGFGPAKVWPGPLGHYDLWAEAVKPGGQKPKRRRRAGARGPAVARKPMESG